VKCAGWFQWFIDKRTSQVAIKSGRVSTPAAGGAASTASTGGDSGAGCVSTATREGIGAAATAAAAAGACGDSGTRCVSTPAGEWIGAAAVMGAVVKPARGAGPVVPGARHIRTRACEWITSTAAAAAPATSRDVSPRAGAYTRTLFSST